MSIIITVSELPDMQSKILLLCLAFLCDVMNRFETLGYTNQICLDRGIGKRFYQFAFPTFRSIFIYAVVSMK
jgi:hypothetical protein